jgi:hypothetical protein
MQAYLQTLRGTVRARVRQIVANYCLAENPAILSKIML